MSFWAALRKIAGGEAAEPGPVEEAPPDAGNPNASTAEAAPAERPKERPLPPAIERLILFGAKGGPSEDEALGLLSHARMTSDEGLALDSLAQGARLSALPERLAIAVSSALVDRGDRISAHSILETTPGMHALLLRADMLADDGDLPGAVATIERVLVRDLDLPGAMERRTSWRKRLGLGSSERRVDPATMTIASPRARAPFDLVKEVARGGSGVVFAAKDRELGRTVALKLYHQPERDRAQLLDEGRVAALLEGPGIVRVFDVDPNEGWLALEWAALGALRDLLALGVGTATKPGNEMLEPLDPWVLGLAQALARVHAAGWVHHDVKPANVLLSPSAGGSPNAPPMAWLGDFGSARRVGDPSPPGSMGYVSPERLAGRASDPRDDVYGFGRVLEDVIASFGAKVDARWRALAARCVGPSDGRPADGAALVIALTAGSG